MALQKNTAAYRVAEYLCELGGATERDLFTALGPDDSLSGTLKELEERSITQRRRSGKTEYVSLTRRGKTELEGGDPYYRENKALFSAARSPKPAEAAGFREAASLCMRCFARDPENGPKVYRKHKPAPGLLFRVMFSRKKETAEEEEKGYLPSLSPEEMEALLETGILYSSAEIKRCFAASRIPGAQEGMSNRGAESVCGSRITAFLFDRKRIIVFFRSAGPIPRFHYDTEREMITALMKAGPRWYPPYRRMADVYGEHHPDAVMIGRSVALIPALIMGYSKGRVKNPGSLEDSERARKNRRYYEERLFNPCCGLFDRVFCVPYFAASAEELRYVLVNDAHEAWDAGARWCRRNLAAGCGEPDAYAALGSSVCAGDRACGTGVIYSPAVDVAFYRGVVRQYAVDPDLRFFFTVVTQPKYADALSHAVGTRIARMLDVFTGGELHPVRYDVYGYPADGTDPYAEASRKRWSSPERPRRLTSVSLCVTEEAAEELKAAAERAGCTVSRLAGHLMSACLDSPEWERAFGRPEKKAAPYAAQLFEQDRRAGTNRRAESSLSSLVFTEEGPDGE